MQSWFPPALLVAALALGLSGAPDRIGLDGASRGLLIGAMICAPLWLLKLWRDRSGQGRD